MVMNELAKIFQILDSGSKEDKIRVLESFKGIKVKQGPYQSIEDDKEFIEIVETDIN